MGIIVIFIAVFMYSNVPNDSSAVTGTVVLKSVAGIVMSTVGYLFSKQSVRKDTMWTTFMENLRVDQQQLASRKSCDEISDPYLRDSVKGVLSMHLAGIKDADALMSHVRSLGNSAPSRAQVERDSTPAETAKQKMAQ